MFKVGDCVCVYCSSCGEIIEIDEEDFDPLYKIKLNKPAVNKFLWVSGDQLSKIVMICA